MTALLKSLHLDNLFDYVAVNYFRFFANFALRRWHPRIIAITGSAGKTTMLHLIEYEMEGRAHYSHHANSPLGISFDLLGVRGVEGSRWRWLWLFLIAPFKAITSRGYKEEYYVVEIDGARPHEAEYVAKWLRPEISLWVTVGLSHAVNFAHQVEIGNYASLDEAIAHEFSTIPEYTTERVYIDGDSDVMRDLTKGIKAKVIAVKHQDLKRYNVYPTRTDFIFEDVSFHFSGPQPKELAVQLMMLADLMQYLKISLRTDFRDLLVAPGRSSYFKGIKGINIIDSSYNAHLISMQSILEMAQHMRTGHKWLVIGDMVDEGTIEVDEHRKLADLIAAVNPEMVILVGQRTKKYTAPRLKELGVDTRTTLDPKKALKFIQENISGDETIIFKGSQYLEWIIEQLLENPEDAARLPRREKAAMRRREKKGLT